MKGSKASGYIPLTRNFFAVICYTGWEVNVMEKGNLNVALNQNLSVKCKVVNSPDEKLSIVNDGITKLKEYSNCIEGRQL